MADLCVIDDKELLRDSLAASLAREDHRVTTFADPAEALEAIKVGSFDGVITDLKMPRMDGITLLRALRSGGCEVPVILMTAYGTVPTAVEAMKLGAFDYIQKPFEADEICVLVERAIQHGRLRAENEALRASLRDLEQSRRLVGDSPVMQDLRRKIDRFASSSSTVLIQGESGTGKELVARAVHAGSGRADCPLLCLNCAALASNLLESELFGHEKGAFTGADRLRKGRFELADRGSLLLDEITELPVALQAKLLRVLQERQFERVGSSTTRTADVRVIATTNRDLADWVSRGKFREDLFYRLNVLPIVVTPLRERREDIPALVNYFLERAARREDGRPIVVEPGAMRLMIDYHWPGNVRELENVCERASVLVGDGVLHASTVRPWLIGQVKALDGLRDLRPGHLLEDMERRLIQRTLAKYNGHRVQTARALGIGVRTLGMKLKRWREEARMSEAASRRAIPA